MKVEINIARLEHLLHLYKMSVDELLVSISKGLKKPPKKNDIITTEVELALLKRIDNVFNKGLHYYLDPKAPDSSKEASIFFRKDVFNSDLNLGARKIVNHFEEFKISLSAISKLAELKTDRRIPVFSVNEVPQKVADYVREYLYPEFQNNKRDFLKALISKLAENNILVFEFVETWNKKDKANIDGFYLNPNVLVLKRQQEFFRREIFTLVHELGHYLLDKEEVEKVDYLTFEYESLSRIERWCNEFAYHFLVGEFDKILQSLDEADASNDYHFDIVESISLKTHLSKLSIFTRLLFTNKVSNKNYNSIKADLAEQYKIRKEKEKLKKESEKAAGKEQKGSTPKPINSPLLISTIQTAFYEGIINEFEVCRRLNIKPSSIARVLQ